MIVLINGPFGVGKTTQANLLVEELDNSMLFDPEEIGSMLRHIISTDIVTYDDFQDNPLWKTISVEIAKAVKKEYQRHLIIPMTIYHQENFRYIYQEL